MRLFSRNEEAVEPARGEVAFESLRRSPRTSPHGSSRTSSRAERVRVGSDGDDQAPLDPAEAAKTRARRRLIGAIALALAAIVFVPMLFDRTPVAPNDDIALQIPDRDSPFEGRRGVPDPSRGPLRAAPEPANAAVVDTPPSIVNEAGPPAAPVDGPQASVPKAPEVATAKPGEKQTQKQSERPEKLAEKPADKLADKLADKPILPGDDPRALAALEGRSAPAEAAGERSYAVQVAAFSAADKAKGLREQLVGNGLRSYTESVSTAQGLRTRVRLGPFASREAADRAKQKLKTMKLDGSVVPL